MEKFISQHRKGPSVIMALAFLLLFMHAERDAAQSPFAPLSAFPVFEENRGQFIDMENQPVKDLYFKCSVPGIEVCLTSRGITYFLLRNKHANRINDKSCMPVFEWNTVQVLLEGAKIEPSNIEVSEAAPGHKNYFLGHCPGGLYGVRSYHKITVRDIYPGIDWILYGSEKTGLKYDFIIRPGADASRIRMNYTSIAPATITDEGHISVRTPLGFLLDNAPYSYTVGNKKTISSRFRKLDEKVSDGIYATTFGFSTADYDRQSTLVIDPLLTWSTFYGGNTEDGTFSIECDAQGNVFTCGLTGSFNLPLLNAGTYYQGTGGGISCQFIAKFNSSNSRVWATYYGGTGTGVYQYANDLAIDGSGNVFMCGTTNATNYPVQSNGTFFQPSVAGSDDACIVKFDNSGNRVWATYFGGSSVETCNSISVDASGNIFLTGTSQSTNMPLQNAGTFFQSTFTTTSAGMILKFSNSGGLLWSTYFNGVNPLASAVDGNDQLYFTGGSASGLTVQNPGGGAFFQGTGNAEGALVKFANNGTLLWSTFIGGSGLVDQGRSITTDKYNNVYVCGITTSTNFPLQNAGGFFQNTLGSTGLTISDAFIMKFSPAGSLLWSTLLGGNDNEAHFSYNNLVTDTCGNLYASFTTKSSNMHTQPSCEGGFIDSVFDFVNSGSSDQYLARFDTSTNCTWATYAGGNGLDIRASLAVSPSGPLYMTGQWTAPFNQSANYPLVGGGTSYIDSTANGNSDVYIMKFEPIPATPTLSYGGKVICSNDGTIAPAGSLPAGGTYSATSGLSIHPVTGLITPSASAAGVFTVVYAFSYSTCLCYAGAATSTMAVVTVTIGLNPTLTVTSPGTVCAGQSALVHAAGATTYSWSNFSTNDSIYVSPAATTAYTVTGSSASGCKSTATLQLGIVQPAPVSISGPTLICGGDSALLVASGAVSYSWSTGATAPSIVVKPASSSTFTLTAIDSAGCVTGAAKNVSVMPVPVYPISGCATICAGSTATLQAITPSNISYTWNTGSSHSVIIVSPSVTTVFSNTFIGPGGCSHVASCTIGVIPSPTISITGTANICQGTVFSATVTGAQSYTWNNSLAGATFSQVITSTQTVYAVGKDAFGCTGHDTVVINMLAIPLLTLSPYNATVCTGDAFTVSVTGASGYTWSNGATGPQTTFTAGSAAGYSVIGINQFGCYNSAAPAVMTRTCSGLSETERENQIRIYPNPSKGSFTIKGTSAMELFLVNELGQVIKKIDLTPEKDFETDVSGISAGVYFITTRDSMFDIRWKVMVEN